MTLFNQLFPRFAGYIIQKAGLEYNVTMVEGEKGNSVGWVDRACHRVQRGWLRFTLNLFIIARAYGSMETGALVRARQLAQLDNDLTWLERTAQNAERRGTSYLARRLRATRQVLEKSEKPLDTL